MRSKKITSERFVGQTFDELSLLVQRRVDSIYLNFQLPNKVIRMKVYYSPLLKMAKKGFKR